MYFPLRQCTSTHAPREEYEFFNPIDYCKVKNMHCGVRTIPGLKYLRSGWKQLVFIACLSIALVAQNVTQAASSCESRISWPVVDVLDGDTIVLARSRYELFRVRIYGVDAPEPANPKANTVAQPFSEAATKFTRDLLLNRIVCVQMTGGESYGRVVANVYINGKSVGHALVKKGLAWWAFELIPQDPELARLHRIAQKNGLGLWSDVDPIPPWEWRSLLR